MRIARVITRLDVQGGAELSTLIEVEELAARGHDVAVVTVVEPPAPAAVARLAAAGVRHRHLSGRIPRQAFELRRWIRSWKPDVVHAVILRAEVVAALAGVKGPPTLVSLVNMQYDERAVSEAPSPRRLEITRRFESLLLRLGVDHFHCLTAAGRDHSVDHLGIPPSRITVIPRGRRPEDLVADRELVQAIRAESGDEPRPLVVNVGRHERQKGQDLLLDAIGRLRSTPDPRCLIAGREGNGTSALRAQIDGLGLAGSVELLGARRDVTELLAAADVVAVTSRWEGLGGAIIEALGVGAPIVAFGVPAVREVVGDGGVVVAPFDVVALADAIHSVLDDPALRAELSARARRRFESTFDIRRVIDALEGLYVDLADRQLS